MKGFVEFCGEIPWFLLTAFLSQAGDSLMRTLSVISFVAALVAVSFAGPVSAEPQGGCGGGCGGYETLSVEN